MTLNPGCDPTYSELLAAREREPWSAAPPTVERFAQLVSDRADAYAAILIVRGAHDRRVRSHNGFTEEWCRECGQDWPCPTRTALAMLGTSIADLDL